MSSAVIAQTGASSSTPEAAAVASEQALVAQVFVLLDEARGTPQERLARLDAFLPRVAEPSVARGLLQAGRAETLGRLRRTSEAQAAIEEAVRLAPSHPMPYLIGVEVYTFSERVARAADLLLIGSRIEPAAVRLAPSYILDTLFERLDFLGEKRRSDLIADRLVEIGYAGGHLNFRSELARKVAERRIAADDVAGASAVVPQIVKPADLALLLVDDRYRALWPAIEAWAGPRLEKQWPVYLAQTRRDWEASRDPEAGTAYAGALRDAGRYGELVDTFLPVLLEYAGRIKDNLGFTLVAPTVQSGLFALGRTEEALALMDRLAEACPLDLTPFCLNPRVNRALLLIRSGQFAAGLQAMDDVLAQAARFGPQVNASATARMHGMRACALHKLGRDSEAEQALAMAGVGRANQPGAYVDTLLCMSKMEAAHEFLVERMADLRSRGDALMMLQPRIEPDYKEAAAREHAERAEQLRRDPKLLDAARAWGRVLDFPIAGHLGGSDTAQVAER